MENSSIIFSTALLPVPSQQHKSVVSKDGVSTTTSSILRSTGTFSRSQPRLVKNIIRCRSSKTHSSLPRNAAKWQLHFSQLPSHGYNTSAINVINNGVTPNCLVTLISSTLPSKTGLKPKILSCDISLVSSQFLTDLPKRLARSYTLAMLNV